MGQPTAKEWKDIQEEVKMLSCAVDRESRRAGGEYKNLLRAVQRLMIRLAVIIYRT
ncbi:MAG: hypothetical protein ABFD81_02540 [Syntrophaceae bacterium]